MRCIAFRQNGGMLGALVRREGEEGAWDVYKDRFVGLTGTGCTKAGEAGLE